MEQWKLGRDIMHLTERWSSCSPIVLLMGLPREEGKMSAIVLSRAVWATLAVRTERAQPFCNGQVLVTYTEYYMPEIHDSENSVGSSIWKILRDVNSTYDGQCRERVQII